jgi:hypothetical protein
LARDFIFRQKILQTMEYLHSCGVRSPFAMLTMGLWQIYSRRAMTILIADRHASGEIASGTIQAVNQADSTLAVLMGGLALSVCQPRTSQLWWV